jgi:molybdopterin/thiamine biosynthesis adenylyltransferase
VPADFVFAPIPEALASSVPLPPIAPAAKPAAWSYEEAFVRNRGLITAEEQQRLRSCRAAIAGMGGVGGIDTVTLARLGVGKFTIADPDEFEISNTNRQYGATQSTIGESKVAVLARIIHEVNPCADVRVFAGHIGADNVKEFLDGADVLVDGLDAFEVEARRTLFRCAADRNIYALGAGPVGFSTVWIVFDPRGMSFDRYFNLSDALDPLEKFVHYVVGMAPAMTQRRYMDLSYLSFQQRSGPSAAPACQLAGGVAATEVLKILLRRGPLYSAPYYHQFDAYAGRFVRRRLLGANRNPIQRAKIWWFSRYLRRESAPALNHRNSQFLRSNVSPSLSSEKQS